MQPRVKLEIRSDNHTHILNHGLMPLIKSARVNSVQNLAVTEHISQFREAREEVQFSCYHKSGVVFDSLRDYLNEFRKLEADHTLPLKLNAGLEVDFIPRYEETIRKYVEQEGDWAMLLCAVHEFDEIGGVERPGLPQDRESSKDRWRRYIQTQIEALESRYIRFKVLAHPVRLVASTPVYPDEILEMLRGLAIAGERKDVALELNGRDMIYDPGLVEKLAHACKQAGCKVSLGSDAHYAEDVYSNSKKAEELVSRYTLETIV